MPADLIDQRSAESCSSATDDAKSFLGFQQLLPLIGLLILFTSLNLVLLHPWTLSEGDYRSPSICLATLKQLPQPSTRSLIWIALVFFLAANYRSLKIGWCELDRGIAARVIVSVSALVLGWMYSTYDYNHYLGRAHTFDRILTATLALSVVWRPAFVFPFLFFLWPLVGQFNVPIGGYSWAIAFLPARILLLFGAWLLIAMGTKTRVTSHFWFLLICLIAGHYFPSGLGKLKIGWLFYDRIYYFLPAAYSSGWLGFLDADSITSMTRLLTHLNWPMKIFTLVAECGAIVVLARRRTVPVFAMIWLLFHIGIFCVSGFFFWPWILIQLALFVLSLKTELIERWQFGVAPLLTSIVLIGASPEWVRAVNLSWIDSPITYRYRLQAIGASGTEYRLGPTSMRPYSYQFTLSEFHYLSNEPTIRSHGLAAFRRLQDVRTDQDVLAAESEIGRAKTQAAKVDRFAQFMGTFFRSLNARGPEPLIPRWMCAPDTLCTFSPDRIPREPIVQISVSQALTGFIDDNYREIRIRPVLSLNIENESDKRWPE